MEKLKKFFKEKNKKTENLISFLVILVITLIIINNIIKDDDKKEENKYKNAELANEEIENDLEKRLERILSKIDGVGEVSVLVTYSVSNNVLGKTEENEIEGAIVTASGAENSNVRSNIVSAVEAVTGLATHKVQVFTQAN